MFHINAYCWILVTITVNNEFKRFYQKAKTLGKKYLKASLRLIKVHKHIFKKDERNFIKVKLN